VANQKGLRLVGWAYGGLAATVALIAFVVVSAQINGQVQARDNIHAQYARAQ
jgi:hypothetical protein